MHFFLWTLNSTSMYIVFHSAYAAERAGSSTSLLSSELSTRALANRLHTTVCPTRQCRAARRKAHHTQSTERQRGTRHVCESESMCIASDRCTCTVVILSNITCKHEHSSMNGVAMEACQWPYLWHVSDDTSYWSGDLLYLTDRCVRQVRLVRRELDFIKLNGKAVKQATMKRSPSATALDELRKRSDEAEKSYKRGQVPN